MSFHAIGGTTYFIAVDGFSAGQAGNIALMWTHTTEQGTAGLGASILPYARSVQVGTPATAFANIINVSGSTAIGCYLQMPAGSALAGTFSYQTADAGNRLIGAPNIPIDIPNNAIQNFVFGFTPSQPFTSTDIPIVFDCENKTPVATSVGVNTFLLAASSTPSPDLVAIAATVSGDGIVRLPSASGTHFFATAAVNLGSADQITASVDDGGSGLPLSMTICQTNPTTGACINPGSPAALTATTIANNQVVTYAIFVQALGQVAFDPGGNRLFLRLQDSGGVTRGATHVAVCTGGNCPAADPPPPAGSAAPAAASLP